MTDAEIIAELKREPAAELRRLQKQPYKFKVEHALDVIREFVEHEGENGVYVSFSGGKDSLVLLHLVRSIYPDVPAVFANTGIEFPEQVKFVRSLQLKKVRDAEGLFVAEGEKCVEELRRGFELVSLYREGENATRTEIEQMSSLKTPQGVIGVFKKSVSPKDGLSVKTVRQ